MNDANKKITFLDLVKIGLLWLVLSLFVHELYPILKQIVINFL